MAEFFYEISVSVPDQHPKRDTVIPSLDSLGCNGYLEENDVIKGYMPVSSFPEKSKEDLLKHLSVLLPFPCTLTMIEDQNWNAIWERDYEPVLVEGKCLIRAPFHPPASGILYDIVIEPRMSFGTAHHETTYMMISLLLKSHLKGMRVLDMGSGTAVLAILAEMLGATEVWAVDNDAWAFQNAGDNVLKNNALKTKVVFGDAAVIAGETFDLILANINRNILTRDMRVYRKSMRDNGLIYFSGFYEEDMKHIMEAAEKIGLRRLSQITRNRWVAAVFQAH